MGDKAKFSIIDGAKFALEQVQEASSYDEDRPLEACQEEVQKFLHYWDKVFLYGLRSVKKGYWKLVSQISHPVLVNYVIETPGAVNDLMRSRVWLCSILNDNELENYLVILGSDQKLLQKFYRPEAILRDSSVVDDLISIACGQENTLFSIHMDYICYRARDIFEGPGFNSPFSKVFDIKFNWDESVRSRSSSVYSVRSIRSFFDRTPEAQSYTSPGIFQRSASITSKKSVRLHNPDDDVGVNAEYLERIQSPSPSPSPPQQVAVSPSHHQLQKVVEGNEEEEEVEPRVLPSVDALKTDDVVSSSVGSVASSGAADPTIKLTLSVSADSLPEKSVSPVCGSPSSCSVQSRKSSAGEKLQLEIGARANSYSSLPRDEDTASIPPSPPTSVKRRKMKLVRIESTVDGSAVSSSPGTAGSCAKERTTSSQKAQEIEALMGDTNVTEVSEALKVSMDLSDEDEEEESAKSSESPDPQESEADTQDVADPKSEVPCVGIYSDDENEITNENTLSVDEMNKLPPEIQRRPSSQCSSYSSLSDKSDISDVEVMMENENIEEFTVFTNIGPTGATISAYPDPEELQNTLPPDLKLTDIYDDPSDNSESTEDELVPDTDGSLLQGSTIATAGVTTGQNLQQTINTRPTSEISPSANSKQSPCQEEATDDPKHLGPPISEPRRDDVSPVRSSSYNSRNEVLIDRSIEKEISEASLEVKDCESEEEEEFDDISDTKSGGSTSSRQKPPPQPQPSPPQRQASPPQPQPSPSQLQPSTSQPQSSPSQLQPSPSQSQPSQPQPLQPELIKGPAAYHIPSFTSPKLDLEKAVVIPSDNQKISWTLNLFLDDEEYRIMLRVQTKDEAGNLELSFLLLTNKTVYLLDFEYALKQSIRLENLTVGRGLNWQVITLFYLLENGTTDQVDIITGCEAVSRSIIEAFAIHCDNPMEWATDDSYSQQRLQYHFGAFLQKQNRFSLANISSLHYTLISWLPLRGDSVPTSNYPMTQGVLGLKEATLLSYAWKEYYFILDNGKLTQFDKECSGTVRNEYSIIGASGCRKMLAPETTKRFAFKFISDEGVQVMLNCKTSYDRDKWMSAISETAMELPRKAVPTNSGLQCCTVVNEEFVAVIREGLKSAVTLSAVEIKEITSIQWYPEEEFCVLSVNNSAKVWMILFRDYYETSKFMENIWDKWSEMFQLNDGTLLFRRIQDDVVTTTPSTADSQKRFGESILQRGRRARDEYHALCTQPPPRLSF